MVPIIIGIVLVSLACVAMVGYILFRPVSQGSFEPTVAPAEEPREWVSEDTQTETEGAEPVAEAEPEVEPTAEAEPEAEAPAEEQE